MAWLIPAISVIGGLISSNNQNHAANSAANAANTAAQGQNQLDQQTVALLNSMYQDYQKNYQPLEGPMSQSMAGYQGQQQQYGPQSMDRLMQALTSPQGRDAQTGVPLQALQGNALDYFSNPGQTLSGLGGVGGTALSQLLSGNTNFQQSGSQAQQYFSNPQNTATNQLTPDAIAALNPNAMRQVGAADQGHQALQGISNNLARSAGYAGNQIDSARAQDSQYGGTQAGIDPSQMIAGGQAVGGDTLNYFQNEMRNGLDPAARGAAMNEAQNANSREINSLRQTMGANTPNAQGLTSDLAERAFASNANLASSLAGQDQGLRTQGAQGAFGTAQGIDQETMQRLLSQFANAGQLDQGTMARALAGNNVNSQLGSQQAGLVGQNFGMQSGVDTATGQRIGEQLGAGRAMDQQTGQMYGQGAQLGQQMDAQTYQRLAQAMQTAGGMDAQTQSMLMQALGIGNQATQQQMAGLTQASGTSMDLMTMLQNYIGQGRNIIPGVASGLQGIAQQYGQAGANAANNAQAAGANAAANNPFSMLGNAFAQYQAAQQPQTFAQAGGGLGPAAMPSIPIPQGTGVLPGYTPGYPTP